MPAARLDAYAAGPSLFDRNIGNAELPDGPGVGHEMSARTQSREGGDAACERERQQQLIGEVKLDCGIGSMVLAQSRDCFVGNGLGRLSQATISREAGNCFAIFGGEKNAGARTCRGHPLRLNINRHAELAERCRCAPRHALGNMSGQVGSDCATADSFQRTALPQLDRPRRGDNRSRQDSADDLTLANRIPALAL